MWARGQYTEGLAVGKENGEIRDEVDYSEQEMRRSGRDRGKGNEEKDRGKQRRKEETHPVALLGVRSGLCDLAFQTTGLTYGLKSPKWVPQSFMWPRKGVSVGTPFPVSSLLSVRDQLSW